MLQGIALFGIIIVLYGALAGRPGRWSITAPMIFVAAGFVLGPGGLNLHQVTPRTEGIKELTEITLALLLFADASTLSFLQVREDARLPLRLLTIGLLLTIALGFVTALGLLPGEAEVTESTENLGTFLSILVWGIFGALFLPLAFQATTNWRPLASRWPKPRTCPSCPAGASCWQGRRQLEKKPHTHDPRRLCQTRDGFE